MPLGEDSRTFAGYPTVFHALAVASTIPNVGLIYQAAFDPGIGRRDNPFWFGRFLVFDTGMTPFAPAKNRRIVPDLAPDGVINVRFTNLQTRDDTRGWKDRVAEAAGGERASDIYAAMRKVIEDFGHFESREVVANRALANTMLTPEQRIRLFKATVVNVDLNYLGDGVAYNSVTNGDEHGFTHKFCEASNADTPDPFIAVSQNLFDTSSRPLRDPFYLLSSLAHEAMHMRHTYRAAVLLDQWRSSQERHKPEFDMWVKDRSKVRKSGVSKFDFLLALDLCVRMNATDLVHFEPHVEDWILNVTHLPVSELEFPPDLSRFPAAATFIAIETRFYGTPSCHYDRAPCREIVLDHVKPRLVKTYGGLSRERKALVQDSLAAWVGTRPRNEPHPFLDWLAGIWSKGDRAGTRRRPRHP